MRDAELRRNKFLAGLVDQYGGEAVEAAAMAALEYPARLAHTATEAVAISEYLTNQGSENHGR